MFYKLDRSLWGILVATLLMAAPSAQALTDDVAVQLLDRLNELEEEVSGLKGENELLRDKLQGVSSRQEELDILRKQAKAADDVAPAVEVIPATVDAENHHEPTESAPPLPDDDPLADIPPLESANQPAPTNQAATLEKLTAEPATETEPDNKPQESLSLTAPDPAPVVEPPTAVLPVAEAPAREIPAVEALPVTAASPVETAQPVVELTPAAVTSTTVTTPSNENVDPRSTDSYYFYGTGNDDSKSEATAGIAGKSGDDATDTAPATAGETPAEQQTKAEYNLAYKLMVNNPSAAAPAFRTFLKTYPDHALAANAQYWLAEALYAQRDYQNASQEFMKVLKQHKDSPKAPGAALKLGYSFYELSQWDYARRTLEDTVKFFPESNAAKLAEERLQRMTTEGH